MTKPDAAAPIPAQEVVFSDHPDFIGGVKWSDCELRWINARLNALRQQLTEAESLLRTRNQSNAAAWQRVAELENAVRDAIAIIQVWHNMGMSPKVASDTWDIYWRNAPEMKPIREVLMRPAAPRVG